MSKHLSAVRRIGVKAVRHRLALPAALLVSALGIASVPAGSIASASTGSTSKSFTVIATPAGTLYAGTPGTVSYAITNTSSQQTFGSTEVTFPGLPADSATGSCPQDSTSAYGVCVNQSSVTSNWTVSLVSSSSTGSVFLFEAETNAAAVLPTQALDFSVTVNGPPASQPTTYTPTAVVKQANDFNGSGNEFQDAGGSPSFTVVGYTLKFVSPQLTPVSSETVYQSVPTSDAFNYLCPPIEVEASYTTSLDQTVGVAGVQVSVGATMASAPGSYVPAGLWYTSGGATEAVESSIPATTSSTGVAIFAGSAASCTDGFAAANSGSIALLATAPGAVSSAPLPLLQLTVDPVSGACASGVSSCTGDISNSSPGASISNAGLNLQQDAQHGYTYLGHYPSSLETLSSLVSCDTAVAGTGVSPASFQFQTQDATVGGDITLTYSKAVVDGSTNNGTPQLPVCAAADVPFFAYNLAASDGVLSPGPADDADGDVYTGSLYNCSDQSYIANSASYPLQMCVVSRSKSGQQGGEIVEIQASSLGDPYYGF